ncbi:MAG: 4-hydroxybenzoate octaprenyltransferase [Steroidobacteraceae bacterium]
MRPTDPWWVRRWRDSMQLMRFDKPIGIWLLLWPVLWALWVAGEGHPNETIFVIFVVGAVVMRAAGCIANDLTDRNIDPFVRRTRDRPLAARRLSPYEAMLMLALLGGVALYLVAQLDPLTLRLAFLGAALTLAYPFFKRFFPAPQLVLGVAFGYGVPMAFVAQYGNLPRVGWLLFIAAIFWALIYDTEYAMVDRDDDLKIGVRSTAIIFGDLDRLFVAALQLLMLTTLYLAGTSMRYGHWYQAGLVFAAGFFVYQQWLIRRRDAEGCFRAFLNNNYVGMCIFAGLLLEYSLSG